MENIEEIIGYKFNNNELLNQAFTHSSYSKSNYERLEFLGDAVLELVVSYRLFNNTNLNEGELTKLRSNIVSGENLAKCFNELHLDKFVVYGKSLKKVSESIKEDIVEALIGAIFLDGDFDAVEKFVLNFVVPKNLISIKKTDYKTLLQEELQKNGPISIEYKDICLDVDKQFHVDLYVNKKLISSGNGKNKKIAQQMCAKIALDKLVSNKSKN